MIFPPEAENTKSSVFLDELDATICKHAQEFTCAGVWLTDVQAKVEEVRRRLHTHKQGTDDTHHFWGQPDAENLLAVYGFDQSEAEILLISPFTGPTRALLFGAHRLLVAWSQGRSLDRKRNRYILAVHWLAFFDASNPAAIGAPASQYDPPTGSKVLSAGDTDINLCANMEVPGTTNPNVVGDGRLNVRGYLEFMPHLWRFQFKDKWKRATPWEWWDMAVRQAWKAYKRTAPAVDARDGGAGQGAGTPVPVLSAADADSELMDAESFESFNARLNGQIGRRIEYAVPDGRTFVVPPTELIYGGDPVPIVLKKEAQTRTRLKDGGNPLWFIRMHVRFMEERDPAAGVSFGEYASRLHPNEVEWHGPENGVDTRPTGGGSRGSARRGGSKVRSDPKADAKIATDCRASGQPIKDFATDHGRTYADVKKALDRHRKRRK